MFRKFLQTLKRNGLLGVWRLETQVRGMAHYHCLICYPEDFDIENFIEKKWLYYIDTLPPMMGIVRGKAPNLDRNRTVCQRTKQNRPVV